MVVIICVIDEAMFTFHIRMHLLSTWRMWYEVFTYKWSRSVPVICHWCVDTDSYAGGLVYLYRIYHATSVHYRGAWITKRKSCSVPSLQWRHSGRDSVSNHQPHDCLINRLFRRRSNQTSKFRVTGLCVGKSPGPVNSPHKWPVTRKMFPFDGVILFWLTLFF